MNTFQTAAMAAEAAGRKAYRERALNSAGVLALAHEMFASELERDAFVGGYNSELWQHWGRGPNVAR